MSIRNVVFIDSRVANPEALIADAGDATAVYRIDSAQDGIAQMQRILADYASLDSIQIFSHGAAGTLYLGSTAIDGASLDAHAAEVRAIGTSLADTGDMLLYGCHVASGTSGAEFIGRLAQLTGADVAASTDRTGASALGGNWTLEAATGAIEATSVLSAQGQHDWSGTLAWYDALTDASLRNLVVQDLNDASFSFQEVLDLLSTAATDGVSRTEFADLGTFYQNATGLFSSDYLRYITDAVINGNRANDTWWGGAASTAGTLHVGNLAAGSSEFVLDRLIDEWFKGLDLPSANLHDGTTYQYSNADSVPVGPLFVDGATAFDIDQGFLGDCYLMAALGAIADDHPQYIYDAFTDNGNGTYGVRFFYGGRAVYTTVNCNLPLWSGTLAFAGNATGSPSDELWVPLLEKAYAQVNAQVPITTEADRSNSYGALDGGWAYPLRELTNLPYTYYSSYFQSIPDPLAARTFVDPNPAAFKDTIVDALNAGAMVWLGSFGYSFQEVVEKLRFLPSHAFMVLGYNSETDTFTVLNPLGSPDGLPYEEEFEARFEEFWNPYVKAVLAVSTPPPDTTGPTVTALSPADDSAAVAVTANLVLRFNEAVKPGAGHIVIYDSQGTAVATIAATDSTQVAYDGATVTIDPTANLAGETRYYVNVSQGAFQDLAGNDFGGISGTTIFNFVTAPADRTAPRLTHLTPSDDSTAAAIGGQLELTFDEDVKAGRGNIVLYNGAGAAVEAIPVTDSSRVSITGHTVTIDPRSELAVDSAYYVRFGADVIRDLAGNAFAGITDTTTFNFKTVATLPDDYADSVTATGAPLGSLAVGRSVIGSIDFSSDRDVFAVTLAVGRAYTIGLQGAASGSGSLDAPYLRVLDNTGATLAVGSKLSTSNDINTLFVAPATGTYFVSAERASSASPGGGSYKLFISDGGDVRGPRLVNVSPADKSTEATVDGPLVLTFDEAVTLGSGTISFFSSTGQRPRDISITDGSQVHVSGNTVTVDPSLDFSSSASYEVIISNGAIRDLAGGSFTGTIGSAYRFTFKTAAAIFDDRADKIGDITAPMGQLAPGGSVAGAIESVGDHDLFRLNLVGGTTYVVDLLGADSGTGTLADPLLRMLGSTGDVLTVDDDSGNGLEARLAFTPTVSGLYYVDATHQGNGTGTYRIDVSAPADTAAPLLIDRTPADNTTGVASSSNIVLTFNEAVAAGHGNIVLRDANGAIVRTLDVTDTTQVTMSDRTVTIDFTDDLTPVTRYSVNVDAGALVDTAGNPFAGISGATAYDFVTADDGDDDYADSVTDVLAVMGNLTVEGSATGAIESAGDHDLFQVTLDAFTTYAISLRGADSAGGTLSDPQVRLLNSAGVTLLSDDDLGAGLDASLYATVTNAGTYYIDVSHHSATTQGLFSVTGTYTVELRAQRDTTAPTLVSFSPADESLDVPLDGNIVLTYDEAVRAGTGFLYLYNSNGTLVSAISLRDTTQVSFADNTVIVDPTAVLADGVRYQVFMDGGAITDVAGNAAFGIIGTRFDFTAHTTDDFADAGFDRTAPLGIVTIDDSVSGTIETAGDRDLFKLQIASSPQQLFVNYYDIDLLGAASDGGTLDDPSLRIFDHNFQLIATDDDSGLGFDGHIRYMSGRDEYIYIEAAHRGDGTGTYALHVSGPVDGTGPVLIDHTPSNTVQGFPVDGTLVLTFNEDIVAGSGDIVLRRFGTAGDIPRHFAITDTGQVTVSGHTVTITPENDLDLQAQYSLTMGRGVVQDLAGNEFAGIDDPFVIRFYTASWKGDDYASSVTDTTSPTGHIVPGQGATGHIETDGDHDLFRVSLSAGATYTLDVEDGGFFDAAVRVRNSAGVVVASHDSYGDITNWSMTFRPSSSGTYTIDVAATQDLSVGSYSLALQGPRDTTAPTITKFLPADNATAVAVESAIVLTFSEDVKAGSGNIVLYNGNGTVARTIAVTDTSQVTMVGASVIVDPLGDLETNSAFYVGIGAGVIRDMAGNTFAGITGTTAYNFTTIIRDDYANSLTDTNRPLGTIAVGSSVTGNLRSADDHDLFQFTLTGGTGYVLELKGADSKSGTLANPLLRLLDGSGHEIAFDDDSGDGSDAWLTFTPTADGTFYVDAGQSGTGTGNYRLSVGLVHLLGDGGNNTLVGDLGANIVDGFGGNDSLDGGAGNDLMRGGSGDDTYYVRDIGDAAVEDTDGGDDLVLSYLASYTLGDNIERARAMTAGSADLLGNALDNVLFSGSGNNQLSGGDGNDTADYRYAGAAVTVSLGSIVAQATGGAGRDTLASIENLVGSNFGDRLNGNALANILDGGGGVDTLTGGGGDDTYCVDSASDVIVEASASGGYDIVLSTAGNYLLAGNVEAGRVLATGTANLTGNGLANLLIAGAGNNVLNGGGGSDTVDYRFAGSRVTVELGRSGGQDTGGSQLDTLVSIENVTGSAFADSLYGTRAANVIDGGGGADIMTGDDGDDTYYVDDVGDLVVEINAVPLSGGVDTVFSALASYRLGENIEQGRVLAAGDADLIGNALDNVLFAGSGNNILDGDAGSDTVDYRLASAGVTVSLAASGAQDTGGSGLDTLVSIENVTGSAFGDLLEGDDNANVIDGGLGVDTLTGGAGDDTYGVRDSGDVIVEADAGGNDLVLSYLGNYTLGSNIERGRTMLATASNLVGNSLDNVLYAGAGNNVLNGGAGNDTADYRYAGGAVTVSLGTSVAQATVNSGQDTLLSVENLTGSRFNDTLTGNGLANILDGGLGRDILAGGNGDDTYYVDNTGDVVSETNAGLASGGFDTVYSLLAAYTLAANVEAGRILSSGAANLTGNALANVLYAGSGDNVLNGGGGVDIVDYRYADAAVAVSLAILIAQETGGSGRDTLANIENLTGSRFDDTLEGNAAANVIDGGQGADRMTGGDGNDTYYVDNPGDTVVEINALAATGGIDLVLSAGADCTLADNVENGRVLSLGAADLTGNTLDNVLIAGTGDNVLDGGDGLDTVDYRYAGSGVFVDLGLAIAQNTGGSGQDTLLHIEHLAGSAFADTLIGDAGANTLNGGAGADLLAGGAGRDVLVGGPGNDIYRFDTAPGADNIDTITDFAGAGPALGDMLHLDGDIFTGLLVGALAANRFESGTDNVANAAATRIVYNTQTGALFYDEDGSGSAFTAQQFAILANHAAVTAADFAVV